MGSYRAKWASKRVFSLGYLKKIRQTLANPFSFYLALASKIIPDLRSAPVKLRLKDSKVLEIGDFWSLFIFDEIFIQHDYEPAEIAGRSDIRTIIDVGANIGLFTLRASQIWPDARILAFEPNPTNFSALKRHVELNKLDEVTIFNEGLSDKCGAFDLFLSPRNIGGHSMYRPTSQAISVKTRTIADALDYLGKDETCDLLKIDCEGCEYAIISSLTPELAARIGSIIVEPEVDLYDVDELSGKLEHLGFRVQRLSHFIVAVRNEPSQARPSATARERYASTGAC